MNRNSSPLVSARRATRVVLRGAVQGVGLRPAVHRLATALDLVGSTRNTSEGLVIEVDGNDEAIVAFLNRLPRSLPDAARGADIETTPIDALDAATFRIDENHDDGPPAVAAPLDRATCSHCWSEVDDPNDRRFGYEFTSCTDCGPRYSILNRMPFDRDATAMSRFHLCRRCRHEFDSIDDRRLHAETMACPQCGPHVWFVDGSGGTPTLDWLPTAAQVLRTGGVLAVKGLGGYQLLVNAANSEAVRTLRQRKRRPLKPFAVLVDSLASARRIGRVDTDIAAALGDASNPIVLVPKRSDAGLCDEIAPGLDTIGILLPTTPLHGLLARTFAGPLVCTSANLEGEPLEFVEDEAEQRLAGIVDGWVHHNRPIVHPIDDSVKRVIAGRRVTLRLARGLAPLPLHLPTSWTALAVGAQQKVALAWCNGRQAVLGPHLGDLDSLASHQRFLHAIRSNRDLYRFDQDLIVHDAHPDYPTTRWAMDQRVNRTVVGHHHAHIVAGMLEHGWLNREVLGVAWDGTGLGADGTIWGGEFLRCTVSRAERVASLRPFPLLGGERAVREPWRVAASLLRDVIGPEQTIKRMARLGPTRIAELLRLPERFAPITSSVGRLFDGIAWLLLGLDEAGFEGRPAMCLEAVCDESASGEYPFPLHHGQLDWRPWTARLLDDLDRGASISSAAMRVHRSLARAVVRTCDSWPTLPIVLGGGVFQNRILVEQIAAMIDDRRPIALPGMIPPNDGGLAAGQLAIALASLGGTT